MNEKFKNRLKFRYSFFLFFVHIGFTKIVKLLLNTKFFSTDLDYYMPIRVALVTKNTKLAKILISDKRINKNNLSSSLLQIAIQESNIEIFKLLIQLKAIEVDYYNNHIISVAMSQDSMECIDLLLESSKIDFSDNAVNNCLYGLMNNNILIVKKILENVYIDHKTSKSIIFKSAYNTDISTITDFLWNNTLVKKYLKIDYPNIYNKFIKKDIKNKICEF
jgi:hypothetical protein